jgi:hypothetical protein
MRRCRRCLKFNVAGNANSVYCTDCHIHDRGIWSVWARFTNLSAVRSFQQWAWPR